VSLSFKPDGSVVVYLHDKSKCDCPNGWLFCSHSLALFILIRLIQTKEIGDSSVQDRDGGMANSSSRVTSDDIHEFNRIVVH